MRVSTTTLSSWMLLAIAASTDAFTVPSFLPRCSSTTKLYNSLHEFDNLLGEGKEFAISQDALSKQNRRVVIGGGKQSQQQQTQVQMVSSVAADPYASTPTADTAGESAEGGATSTTEYDPYSQALENQNQKFEVLEAKKAARFDWVKDMTMTDITITLVIPALAIFGFTRWGFNKFSGAVEEKADEALDGYATEMLYHDGDFDEMKLCTKDYKKRLVMLGPNKNDIMLKHYLELYAKKKIVSPQSISSLSYVFTLYKLSEEKAAKILVSLCKKMGPERISSSGKILFFGSHILKSPEGKAALEPIKDMIKDTYRDEETADAFIEASQKAMGEAAYKHAIQEAGKDQSKLTIGWEVLGLDKETATTMWEFEKEEGFVKDRETMYGGQAIKYDKKGRALDKETGKIADPAEAAKAEEEDDDDDDDAGGAPTGNAFECGECGYTLFVAQGREFKFFGDNFKCPECGAAKDKFSTRDDFGED